MERERLASVQRTETACSVPAANVSCGYVIVVVLSKSVGDR
jgi:hypothetical protein